MPLHSTLRRANLDLPRLQIRAAPPVRHTQTGTRRRKSSYRLDRQRTGFPDGGLATGNRQTHYTRWTVQKTRSRLHRNGIAKYTRTTPSEVVAAAVHCPAGRAQTREVIHSAAISTSFSHCSADPKPPNTALLRPSLYINNNIIYLVCV